MEHYLLHLSYTAAGWRGIMEAGHKFDERLGPVRALIAHLGGSFASFHFYDQPPDGKPRDDQRRDDPRRHVVRDKFAMFGAHDLMAVVAMPNRTAAQALTIAISSQEAVRAIELTPLMPFEHAIDASVAASRDAVAAARYAGPGHQKP